MPDSPVVPGADPCGSAGAATARQSWLVRWLLGVRAPTTAANVVPPTPDPDGSGVCCSGGGIRSASYNLGALQALDGRSPDDGVKLPVRYVAAVSGGNYIAGARAITGSCLERHPVLGPRPAFAPGSAEEHYLRNHTRYIAPDAQTAGIMVARLLLGVGINVAIVWGLLNLVARPLGWLYATQLATGLRAAGRVANLPHWVPWAVAVPAAVGALALLIDGVFRPGRPSVRQCVRAWATRLLILAVVLGVGLVVLPFLLQWLRSELAGQGPFHRLVAALPTVNGQTGKSLLSQLFGVLNAVGIGAILLGTLRAFLRREQSKLVTLAATLVAPLVLAFAFLLLLNDATSAGPKQSELFWFLMTVVGLALIELFGDLTGWSMHPFYKRRLASAFALQRVRGADGAVVASEVPYDRRFGLDNLSRHDPQLIVCAAANVSDQGVTPPGRNALSFTFTRDEIGDPDFKLPTGGLEQRFGKRARDLTLPAAMAISGAAVSPSMGKMTRRSYRFLLGLANVRLGVWLPNPRRDDHWKKRSFRPRPHYLLWELLGANHVKRRFLYVTDGGHYENLGLVELLRRGCTTVYCFDASGDKGTTFATLGQAIETARTDLKVEISINPEGLRQDASTRLCGSDHAIGHIFYPDHDTVGHLVYAKAAVTKEAPWDVRAYAQHDGDFPYTSTLYQRFDEQQFEAYRALGAFTASRAVDGLREHLQRCEYTKAPPPPGVTVGAGPAAVPGPLTGIDQGAEVQVLPEVSPQPDGEPVPPPQQ
jgi:hypothetical protein